MITEDYVSFEVAKLLKEKGLNSNWIKGAKPTHQFAMKWLRKEHNLYVSPTYRCFCGSKKNDKPYYKWEDRVLKLPSGNQVHPQIYGIHEYYETYEEAVEAAIKYVLKNLI